MKKSFFSVPRTLPLHALTTFLIGVGCVWPLSLSLGLTAPLSLCLTACGAPAASSAPQPTETPAAVGGENVTLGGRDAQGKNGVVSTGRAEATQIGVDVLKAGGNAVDAAVATVARIDAEPSGSDRALIAVEVSSANSLRSIF